MKDIQEIKDYWKKKYPNIFIRLWANEDNDRYFGLMSSHNDHVDIDASTLGDLIAQGESFLRKIN